MGLFLATKKFSAVTTWLSARALHGRWSSRPLPRGGVRAYQSAPSLRRDLLGYRCPNGIGLRYRSGLTHRLQATPLGAPEPER